MHCLRRPSLIFLAIALAWLNGCASTPRRTGSCPACSCAAWNGVYPTVLTPYTCDGIDACSLENQIRYQLQGGVHGLLILGSIGEGHRLSHEERGQVITTAVKTAAGKVPVIVGIHTTCVAGALDQMRQAKALGATAVLVKYYGIANARPEAVLAFYAALSDSGILPIFFYHFPSDTGLCLPAETIAAILHLANVVGIKESTFNLREVEAHIRLTRDCGKAYFTGSALDLTQFLAVGGSGAMCPEAALLPRPTVAAFDAWQRGDRQRARAIQNDLYNLVPILSTKPAAPCLARAEMMTLLDLKAPVPLSSDSNPAELKYALTLLGVETPICVRPPARSLRPCDFRQIDRAIFRVQNIHWGCESCKQP